MSIYDTMQFIKPPITTICLGMAASMGSLLLTAGQKGQRFALPNSRIMVHQPSAGYSGKVTDIMIYAREFDTTKKRLNEIYVKHTGRSYQEIEDALERDNFMAAEEAKAFGLIDTVIDKRRRMALRPHRRPDDGDVTVCRLANPSRGTIVGARRLVRAR